MSSFNQSNMNDSRNTSRLSGLFSNRTFDDSTAGRQSRENSLISTNRYKSPFYEGKVSFGGSSAKRVRLSKIMPYNLAEKPSNVNRIKDSDIKRLNDFDQLSNATKSVLEKICKASSPIEDAKRIPTFSNQSTEKFMIDIHNRPFKRLSSTRTPFTVPSFKTTSPLDREKLQLRWEELEHSSSQSLNNSLQNINNQNILIANASGSRYQQQQSDSFSLDQQQPLPHSGAGGKMRAKISRTHRSSKWSEDDYLQQPDYELPKNVSLPLPINSNSLSKFNLNKRSIQPQQSTNNVNKSDSLKRSIIQIMQEDDSWDAYDEFRFSAPKAIKLEKISDSFIKNSIRKDTIVPSKSFKITDKNNPVEKCSSASTVSSEPKIIEQLSQPTSLTPSKPSTDSLNLETNKTVGMFRVDKLDNDFNPKENKATLANTNLPPIKSVAETKLSNTFNYDGLNDFVKSNCLPNAKKWTCDTCDVKNELSAVKCAACEQPRLAEVKDKNLNNIYSNYSFNSINLEKKTFNAFKFDSKTPQPQTTTSAPTSIASSNSSLLSNALSTNASTITTVAFQGSSNPLTNSIISNSNKIELNPTTDKITADKSQSISESITLTTTTLNTTSKSNANESTKPFSFITNEVVDKIEKDKQALKPSTDSNWGKQFLPPKGNWNCPGCFASNQLTYKKCPCCEEPNPNLPKESKDSNTDVKSGLSFTAQATGGFTFNIPPTANSSTKKTTAQTESSFSKLINTTSSKNDSQAKGFSFASLVPNNLTSVSKSENNPTQSAPLFSFGAAANNLNSTVSTINATSTAIKPAIGLVDSNKQVNSNSLIDSNKSSNFPASAAIAPSFNFGQPSKDTSSVIKNEQASLNKPASNFSFGNNTLSVTSPPTSNLNNGGMTFSLPATTNQQQSTSLFQAPASSVPNNTISDFNSFSSQFGNKTQFGSSSLTSATAPSSNLFSPANQLSNGFGTSFPENNLFSNPTVVQSNINNQAPVNNFAYSQVPTSFSFGSSDQSQNSNVFQFSANPRNDTSVGVAQMKNPPHVRAIKKAKRRLGSKD